MRILLVDDDENLVEVLSRAFAERNYAIDVAVDGEQGWIYGSTYPYDLIVLDWSLPKLDGISLCRRFRDRGCDTPIILLTSRHGSQNTIRGLDAGADDYICKPFDIEELVARIRALLRRIDCDFLPILCWGELKLNPCNCQVTYQGKPILLAAKEYRLLELFLRHSKDVLSIEEISESLWSSTEYPAEATVRSHLRNLRQKLKQAGLPEDTVITIRGQGYCLKSPPIELERQAPQPPNCSEEKEEQPDKQAQHLAALTSAWEKYRHKSTQQLATLKQAITSLQAGTLEVSDRLSAIVIAHSLAGNLGLFGLFRGSQIAREIEQLLQSDLPQEPEQLLQLEVRLNALQQELTNPQNIARHISQPIPERTELLLIVSSDSNFSEQLTQEAGDRGICTQVIPTPELASIWLEEQQTRDRQLPDAVLLNLSFQQAFPQDYLALIAEFYLCVPSIPAIVIADRDRFQDRLQVARHGSRFFLTQPISASQTITFCQHIIQRSTQGKKILVVDDDIELLQVLPSLLQPWDFNLTTLDDPRQFWDVLQAVVPDLLVLDIEMPHLSGIELCKVLRNHPSWFQLPVLFLSIHNDEAISTQVFASGANDFVNKPVIAQRLATRILNLLMRT